MVAHLAAQNLTLGYHTEPVIADVQLEVAGGSLVAIIGRNGAGKSTLVKGLAGLLSPLAGQVHVLGQPLSAMVPKERAKKIAVLPQTLRFLSGMTVTEFVTQGRYVHRPSWHSMSAKDEAAVAASLATSELEDLTDRALDELSGGERQRALFARALAQETDILLVDEPTAALDGRHQLWAFKKLSDLAQSGCAVVVVTHDLNLASQFAERIVLLEDGRVCAAGRPKDVLQPENLQGLMGDSFLSGSHFACGASEDRPWIIPWWHEGKK